MFVVDGQSALVAAAAFLRRLETGAKERLQRLLRLLRLFAQEYQISNFQSPIVAWFGSETQQ